MDTMIQAPYQSLVQVSHEPKGVCLLEAQEQGQVIVHCMHYGCSSECGRTIQCELMLNPGVHLVPSNGGELSKLLYVYNFHLPPARNFKRHFGTEFTLIFQGLPKECSEFDFIEPADDGQGWMIMNIKRNETDIYYVFFTNESSWEGKSDF